MNKGAYTQGYIKGLQLAKKAGPITEAIGNFNVPGLLSTPIAGAIAAFTKTRTAEQQAKANKETWKNLLIPGRSMYNAFKRKGRKMHVKSLDLAARRPNEAKGNAYNMKAGPSATMFNNY